MTNTKRVQKYQTQINTINNKLDTALTTNTPASIIKNLRSVRESIIHYLESQRAPY